MTKLFCFLILCSTILFSEIRVPNAEDVLRDQPERYLEIPVSFGDEEKIRSISQKEIRGDKSQAPIKIASYLKQFPFDNALCYEYRNFDDILETKKMGSCADYALAWIALARAKGIPAIFVKTLDTEWMKRWKNKESNQSWDGHVYVEFYLQGKWRLIDPGAQNWIDAPPLGESLLSKDKRWIYDRGDDPQTIILSLDWENWKKQTLLYLPTSKFFSVE